MSFLRVGVGDAAMIMQGSTLRVVWVKEIIPDTALFNEVAVMDNDTRLRARDFQRKDAYGVWRACLHPRGRDVAGACFDCGNFPSDSAKKEDARG